MSAARGAGPFIVMIVAELDVEEIAASARIAHACARRCHPGPDAENVPAGVGALRRLHARG
jgi:hypothetical protein